MEVWQIGANELLIWLSARTEGSWPQFRSAVERLNLQVDEADGHDSEAGAIGEASALPLYQSLRLNLERLAHVEFRSVTKGRRWRVVPPTLAITPYGNECAAILCGARSPELRTLLLKSSDEVSVGVDSMPGMPDRIQLVSPDIERLNRIGHALRVQVQQNAPDAIVAAVPPADDPRNWWSSELPPLPGWRIHQFSAKSLRWEQAGTGIVQHGDPALFRFQQQHQRFYFLRWRGRVYQAPVQVGKFAILRRHRVRRLVWYDRSRSVLSVPVTCRPPLLIERALVLCSGLLPQFEGATGRLEYSRVTTKTARLAAALLRQEIHTT